MSVNLRDRLLVGLGHLPVLATAGLIRGAWWTAYPCSAYWRGTHEPATQLAFRRLLPARGEAAWDLGAHFGFYTVALAWAVGSTGQVAAFEPSAASYQKLARHVALNRLRQVRCFPAAVSDSNSERQFVQNQGSTAATAHLPYPGEVIAAGEKCCTVHTCQLDELVETGRLRPPSFVKLDVEGHGKEALCGAMRTISKVKPVMLLSIHSPQELAGIRSQLEDKGYEPESIEGRPVAWSAVGLGEYAVRVRSK